MALKEIYLENIDGTTYLLEADCSFNKGEAYDAYDKAGNLATFKYSPHVVIKNFKINLVNDDLDRGNITNLFTTAQIDYYKEFFEKKVLAEYMQYYY